MSLPLGQPDPIQRANWLGRYLAVERKYDDNLKVVLTDALSGVDEAFAKVKDNFSGEVRRVQLSQSNRALRGVISQLFGATGNLIRNYRGDAAVAAVDAALFDQRSILARLFPDSVARNAYANSLRQSGRRNIESVITRVIETEQPLSQRVYKTRALANGMVSRTINRALARGDSAANLARDVRSLIDPAAPGGVSYAAKRLGRTEINNAFHAQSIHDAQEQPWIQQMEWNLSKVHVTDPGDECEDYAHIQYFDIGHVPVKPHPNCRCYVTSVLPDHEQFQNALIAGQYDNYLDEVIGFKPLPSASGSAPTQFELPKGRVEVVKWDGPKIGKPLAVDSEGVRDAIAYDWKMTTWDQNKKYIREGVRDAQLHGYEPTLSTKRSLAQKHRSVPKIEGDELNESAKEALRMEGREIAAIAADSPPYRATTFYRGMRLTPEQIESMSIGDEISMEASSFTEDQTMALGFAGHPRYKAWAWESRSIAPNTQPVVIEILPGAKVAEIPEFYGSAPEVAAFGRFDVVNVIPGGETQRVIQDYTEVWNKTTKSYVYEPNYVEWKTPTRIQLKQTSMLENAPAASGSAEESTIDGIQVHKRPKSKGYVPVGPYAKGGMEPAFVTSAEEVHSGTQLANFVDDVLGIRPVNIDPLTISDKHANETARALETLTTKYPHVKLRQLEMEDMYPRYYAMTYPVEHDPYDTVRHGWASRMTLNREHFSDDYALADKMTQDVLPKIYEDSHTHEKMFKPGWHHKDANLEPAYSIVTHEFGHAIQNSLGSEGLTGQDITKELAREFSKIVPKPRKPPTRAPRLGVPVNEAAKKSSAAQHAADAKYSARLGDWSLQFRTWLQTTSGYSFGDWTSWAEGAIDRDEIIAESFDAVERLGDKAPLPAQVVHRMLIDRYHQVYDPIDKAETKRRKEILDQIRKKKK